MSDCVNIFFLLDRAEPLFCEHTGGNFSACDGSRNLLHVSSFVVCCSSVKTSFTLLAYRAGHLRTVHVSQLHLSVYLTPELVSRLTAHHKKNIINKNLRSVYRSLEIQNCAQTLSPPPPLSLLTTHTKRHTRHAMPRRAAPSSFMHPSVLPSFKVPLKPSFKGHPSEALKGSLEERDGGGGRGRGLPTFARRRSLCVTFEQGVASPLARCSR